MQRLIPILFLLAAACSGGTSPGGQGDAPPEANSSPPARRESTAARPAEPQRLRLAQVFVLPGTKPWEIQDSVRAASEHGFDVIALRAFHLEGDTYHAWAPSDARKTGVYFPSLTDPGVASDLMEVFVQAAHAEGMKAWAWMTTLDSRWLLEGNPEWAGHQLDPLTQTVSRTRKLDPFHPAVEERLKATFRAIGRSGVDGVLFQDDLVMRHLEGYGPHAEKAWKTYTGAPLDPSKFYENVRRTPEGKIRVGVYTEDYRIWSRWRGDRLLNMAKALGEEAKRSSGKPDFTVCLNVYYDELWSREGGLLWLARDLDAAVDRRFDRYAVMAYHRQIEQETGERGEHLRKGLIRMARRLGETAVEPERFVIKLQTVDWQSKEPIPATELLAAAEPWMEVSPFSLGAAPWDPAKPVTLPPFEKPVPAETVSEGIQ